MNEKHLSNFEESAKTGNIAVEAVADRLKALKNLNLISLEGSKEDKEEGVDYILEGIKGSHRHMSNSYKDFYCIRFTRPTCTKTDYVKLWDKEDNFLYSFTWGYISKNRPVELIRAKALKAFIVSKSHDWKIKDIFGDGVNFLLISKGDFKWFLSNAEDYYTNIEVI